MKRTVGMADEEISPPADGEDRRRPRGLAALAAAPVTPRRWPEGAAFGAAVDQRTATFDVPIGGAREVAFFPPFTGG
jgi:molybdopterin synthase sulfur carrier subunit